MKIFLEKPPEEVLDLYSKLELSLGLKTTSILTCTLLNADSLMGICTFIVENSTAEESTTIHWTQTNSRGGYICRILFEYVYWDSLLNQYMCSPEEPLQLSGE